MKKFYVTLLSLAIAGPGVFAQSKADFQTSSTSIKDRVAPRIDYQEVQAEFNRGGGGPIWSDDFSNPGTWVLDHDATACNLDWEVGQNLGAGGFAPIDTIQSTTKANGYAMIDSDEYGGETKHEQQSGSHDPAP